MRQWVKFVVIVSIMTGRMVCAGCLDDCSAWGQALEVDMLTICHGGQDTAVPETEEDTHGAFTGGGPDGTEPDSYTFDMMKLIVTLPDPACASLEEPVSLEVTGHATLVKQTDEGEHEELGQTYTGSFDDLLPYILVKATAPSEQAKDIAINATFGSCEDTVKATAVSIAWIDDEPDYAREAAEYEEGEYTDNGDSDNFFLRHLVRPRKDDGTPDYSYSGDPDYQSIDLWYRIMPEDLRELDKVVEHVLISIYREDTSETVNTIEVDQEDSLEELDGEQVYHVVWNGTEIRNPATGEFTVAGFYRVQLEAEFDWGSGNGEPVTLTTSIEDGDTELPGWQCPQDGLAIHDLAFKHRPDVWVGSGEVVAPNGPVYPFSYTKDPQGNTMGMLHNYRLCKSKWQILRQTLGSKPAWEGSETNPNYYADWVDERGKMQRHDETTAGFPELSKPVSKSSYLVLEASMDNDGENVGKHYIDIKDPSFEVTNKMLEELEGKIGEPVWNALHTLQGYVFSSQRNFLEVLDEEMGRAVRPDEQELIWEHIEQIYPNRDCEDGWSYLLHRGFPNDPEKTHRNYVFIQYWMYTTASHAPYNKGLLWKDKAGDRKGEIMDNQFNHEADWEMVQIALRLTNPESYHKKSEWLLPYAATAAQHRYGQTLAWRLDKDGWEEMKERGTSDIIQEQRYVLTADEDPNRIKIFIAENSHATYFRSGEIDAVVPPWLQEPGVQVQYYPVDEDSEFYDQISGTPPRSIEKYDLLALDEFDGKGIYDWRGYWGWDVRFGPVVRGPKHSAVTVTTFTLAKNESWDCLRQHPRVLISERLIRQLRPLENEKFIEKTDFLIAVEKKLKPSVFTLYKDKILECADKESETFKKVVEPVSLHESCRKRVDDEGNFNPDRSKDPKTELE